jgi:hypothetical protein
MTVSGASAYPPFGALLMACGLRADRTFCRRLECRGQRTLTGYFVGRVLRDT